MGASNRPRGVRRSASENRGRWRARFWRQLPGRLSWRRHVRRARLAWGDGPTGPDRLTLHLRSIERDRVARITLGLA